MPDMRRQLQGLFTPNSRFANFGEAILKVDIQGFRCHANLSVKIESPITAFCGQNGTGKSTILQLIASSYRSNSGSRNYIHQYIFIGKLDPAPFAPNASVKIEYAQPNGSAGVLTTQVVTVSRGNSKWTGYKRQPKRQTYFAGVGLFLPRIEEWDSATRNAKNLNVGSRSPIDVPVAEFIRQILGSAYQGASNQKVKAGKRDNTVVVVTRHAASYSELHMGTGEGRIYHIVRSLEELPEKSLVVLEEPETSLHPAAQYRFGQYLVDLAIRRKHQVFLTTHSESLLSALPAESRMLLVRDVNGIMVVPHLPVRQAISLMSDGRGRALHILVEDDVAKAIVITLLRSHEPFLLRTTEVVIAGDRTKIQTTMKVLQEQRLSICAVRDADFGDDLPTRMFKLFGTRAPEREIFDSVAFHDYINERWRQSLSDLMVNISSNDHHQWFKLLSLQLGITREQLIGEAAEAYVNGVAEVERLELVQKIKSAVL